MKYFSDFSDNKNNNFNLIRLVATLIVIYTHCYGMTGRLPNKTEQPIAYFIYMLENVGVHIFFVVSGFLITRSYLYRKDYLRFLWARVLRIYPGLICAVIFSVFVIGLYDTNLNLKEYIFNKVTIRFIVDNLSLIKTNLELPGVFESSHLVNNHVNGSFWTLPAEARLYLYVCLLGVVGALAKPKLLNVVAASLIIMYIFYPKYIPLISDNTLYYYTSLMFLIGALFYINKDKVPSSGYIVIILFSVLVYVIYFKYEYKDIIYTVFIPYLVIWFAYNFPSLHFFNKIGDYSYGMYIYAFPIQQLIVTHNKDIGVNLYFLYSVSITSVIAIFSWHLIEKKALKLK